MIEKLNRTRKAQKKVLTEQKKLNKNITQAIQSISEAAEKTWNKIDETTGVSEIIDKTSDSIQENFKKADEKIKLSKHAKEASDATAEHYENTKQSFEDAYKNSGAENLVDTTKKYIDENIVEPVDKVLEKSGVKKQTKDTLDSLGKGYGKTRTLIKPYFEPESPRELLENTREQLVQINACIFQVSYNEAGEWSSRFGKALTAKAAGIVATSALFSFVSVVGTAGTGTAIATLSGAASTTATLAWIGGIAGGGMATGAVITGGLAVIAGAVTYKFISSERRKFEDLSGVEQRLVSVCSALVSQLDSLLETENIQLTPLEAKFLLNTTLIEIEHILKKHSSDIIAELDNKNSFAFKQHVLTDYPKVVLDGFNAYIENSLDKSGYYIPYMIGGVFYALLSKSSVGDDFESRLVLEALRRSTNVLNDSSSEMDIANYLSEYSLEQLQGIANNVKGIYHELLFIHEFNQEHDDKYAKLFGETNHPGADIQIFEKETDQLIEEFQLKATSNTDYIKSHFEKYPDIEVVATEEVASQFSNVSSSQISNEEITNKTNSSIDDLEDNTIGDQTTEAATIASLFAIGLASINVLNGRKKPEEAGLNAVASLGTAASSCAITAYLFGG